MAAEIPFPTDGTIHERVAILMQLLGLNKGEGYGASHFTRVHRKILFDALSADPSCSSYARLFGLMKKLHRTEQEMFDAQEAFLTVARFAGFRVG